MSEWLEREKSVLLPTYSRYPVVIEKGRGTKLYDDKGKEYLDLFSGLAVNVLGHCHPRLINRGKRQLDKYLHISNFYYCKNAIELGEKLIDRSFPGKVFFCNSGAEATEAAIKYLFKIGVKEGRRGIVVIKNSFHGRTLGALSATKMNGVSQDFPSIEYPFYEISRRQIDEIEDLFIEKQPLGILFEIISGSGGIQVFPEEELLQIQRLCKKYDVIMVVDEIQTGIGRTGKFFAYQNFPIDPDILIFAKGIGGGNPLGGIIVRDQFDGYFSPGDHGTTFGPNPLSTAMGLETLEVINDEFLCDVKSKSQKLIKELQLLKEKFPEQIGEIRGLGMMIGVEMLIGSKKDYDGMNYIQKIQYNFIEKGILVNFTQGNILRLLPPLIIEMKEIQEFVKTFGELLADYSAS